MAQALITQVSQADVADLELKRRDVLPHNGIQPPHLKPHPKTLSSSRAKRKNGTGAFVSPMPVQIKPHIEPQSSCWTCFSCLWNHKTKRQLAHQPVENSQLPVIPHTKQLDADRNPQKAQFRNNFLLEPLPPNRQHIKTLVLDLDETLVHSSFKPVPDPDFVLPIILENQCHQVYVLKRPGVDEFLEAASKMFEIVVFTASLATYADPVLDRLDKHKRIDARLFRESCVQHYGNYVKDLTRLGRDLKSVIIVDNSPYSYVFQPDNAIPISSWFNDKSDKQLFHLLRFLESLVPVKNVCDVLRTASPFY